MSGIFWDFSGMFFGISRLFLGVKNPVICHKYVSVNRTASAVVFYAKKYTLKMWCINQVRHPFKRCKCWNTQPFWQTTLCLSETIISDELYDLKLYLCSPPPPESKWALFNNFYSSVFFLPPQLAPNMYYTGSSPFRG